MKGNPIHVAFSFSYDVNMILRRCPRSFVERVWEAASDSGSAKEPERGSRLLWWRQMGVRWIPRHMVRFGYRELYGASSVDARSHKLIGSSVLIYDVFGFFQSSFVRALERWLGPDYPDLPLIREGKARRSDFTPEDQETVLPYCLAECRALVRLMEALRAALQAQDLTPSSWHGPGAVAAQLLQREGVADHMGEPADPAPGELLEQFRRADFGGRIELIRYGRWVPPKRHPELLGWHFDLASAYPWALSRVPSLAGASWWSEASMPPSRGGDLLAGLRGLTPRPDFSLLRVDWSFRPGAPFYPFPYRDSHGAIFYPPEGSGVYWAPEVIQAQRGLEAGVWKGQILVRGWLAPLLEQDIRPFSFIPELYERRRLIREKRPGEAGVLKLALNSLYGKLCQQVGGRADKLPPWFQLGWAGFVCSSVRARLLEMALLDPAAVVAFMTDGLFMTRFPVRARERIHFSDDLGGWVPSRFSELVSVNSGVYFETTPDGRVHSHFRGFDPPTLQTVQGETKMTGLSRRLVVEGYARRLPSIEAPSSRFVQMGVALAQDFHLWDTWWSGLRRCDLSIQPGGAKREIRERRGSPLRGLQRTEAAPCWEASHMLSWPMPLLWGQSAEALLIQEWEDSRT